MGGARHWGEDWARLVGRQTCVVHGDPNPRNIRMTADRAALIDWDEAHVDVPDFDLVLPHNAADPDDGAHDIAAKASPAWEAAVCWDDEFSIKRLAEVSRGLSGAQARYRGERVADISPNRLYLPVKTQLGYLVHS